MPNGYTFQFGGAADDVYVQILHVPDLQQDDPWVGVTRVWGERLSVSACIQTTIRMAQEVVVVTTAAAADANRSDVSYR